MSTESVNAVLRRIFEDSAFADLFIDDAEAALAEYDLTLEEKQALVASNRGTLSDLGAESGALADAISTLGDKCPGRSRT